MQKLVLYSNQILPQSAEIDRRLLALIGKPNPRIGYIPSCCDPARKYYNDRRTYYAQYGVDLSPYFELDIAYEAGLLETLFVSDAIHLSGGNTYYFLHWLYERNLLMPLREYVERGGVLIGVSAGAILMTPNISSGILCGDLPPAGMTEERALGLVDFSFLPHTTEETDLQPIQAFSLQHHTTVYACPDRAGIVVDEEQVGCIGNVTVIAEGQRRR